MSSFKTLEMEPEPNLQNWCVGLFLFSWKSESIPQTITYYPTRHLSSLLTCGWQLCCPSLLQLAESQITYSTSRWPRAARGPFISCLPITSVCFPKPSCEIPLLLMHWTSFRCSLAAPHLPAWADKRAQLCHPLLQLGMSSAQLK